MNLADVTAWAQGNRNVLLAAGAAGAVGLGLMHKSKGKAADAAGDGGGLSATSAGGRALSSSPATSAMQAAAYNSSSTDAYNSLQPYMERLQRMYEQQQNATPATPAPSYAPGIYGQAGGDSVYQLREDGKLDWLTQAEWDGMRDPSGIYPTVNKQAKDSALWSRELVGDGSKEYLKTQSDAAKRYGVGMLVGQSGGQGIYRVAAPGVLDWLSQQEFDGMAVGGKYPTVERLGKDDAVFTEGRLTGDGTLAWH